MEESLVFNFPCETNGNHATELSAMGHRTALEKYFWLNEIYFPLFSETIHTILKVFPKHGLRKCS